jgi:hypothetical protein
MQSFNYFTTDIGTLSLLMIYGTQNYGDLSTMHSLEATILAVGYSRQLV